uniref:RNA-dependent RNA polymerase n=1 Tax=Crocidura lasiura picornavirus 1 TaxID=3139480 RepID=A0AB38ZK12_9VIRU
MSKKESVPEQRVDTPINDDLRDVDKTEQHRQITDFVDEQTELKTEYVQKVKEAKNPYRHQELTSFLERPYVVKSLSWRKADSQGSCIYRGYFPDDLFELAPLWNKLANFQYLRAGLCFTVKVNASPYHFGRLLAVWRPLAVGRTTGTSQERHPCGYDNMYTLSSYPHMFIDPNGCESNDLYATYSLPTEWCELQRFSSATGNERIPMMMGVFEIWVLNPLEAMGSATDPDANIIVYASFTDVELSGYTQTANAFKSIVLNRTFASKYTPDAYTFPVTRMSLDDLVDKVSSSTDGQPVAQGGTLSQMYGKPMCEYCRRDKNEVLNLYKSLKVVFADIEVLIEQRAKELEQRQSALRMEESDQQTSDKVTEGVSSGSSEMSSVQERGAKDLENRQSVSEMEGSDQQTSKEVVRDVPSGSSEMLPSAQAGSDAGKNDINVKPGVYKVVDYPLQLAAGKVDHPAIPLALSQKVGCRDSLATSDNSLQSFLNKPCLLKQFTIAKETPVGKILEVIPVSPMWVPTANIGASARAVFNTRVSFYARIFKMWRGTLRYHFNVVCSKFHSARIRVYWMPGLQVSGEQDTYLAGSAVNKVIDIQGSTDFIVDVPWLNRYSALRTDESSTACNGYLYIDMVNALVYPEAQMPAIQVNVWVSAGKDFECDLLKKGLNLGCVPSWQRVLQNQKEGGDMPQAQSGPEVTEGAIEGHDTIREFPTIVGENIKSIQDLITKPMSLAAITTAKNQITYTIGGREWMSDKLYFFVRNRTLYDYFGSCFAAVSGAIRIHAPTVGAGWICFVPNITNEISMSRGSSTVKTFNEWIFKEASASAAFFTDTTSMKTVTLPYYSNVKYVPLGCFNAGGVRSSGMFWPCTEVSVFDAGIEVPLMASASDNFYFHLPMGVPMMIFPTINTN